MPPWECIFRADGLQPWGHLYNRPFLRALHGHGLSLWRLGRTEEARTVLERMLFLDPADSQGVRFCWDDIRSGRPWRPDEADASDLRHSPAMICMRSWDRLL